VAVSEGKEEARIYSHVRFLMSDIICQILPSRAREMGARRGEVEKLKLTLVNLFVSSYCPQHSNFA
jgi:hypothetical protein